MANILQKQATPYHSYLSIAQLLRRTKGLCKQAPSWERSWWWEKCFCFSLSAQLPHTQLWEQGSRTENGSRCVMVKQRHSAGLFLFKDMNRKRSSKSHRNPLGCFFLVVFKFLLASKPNKATLWWIAFEFVSCCNMARVILHWLSH